MSPTTYGARLGLYQGNALGAPVLSAYALGHGDYWLAMLALLGAAFGWAGWWRDYRFAWLPYLPEWQSCGATTRARMADRDVAATKAKPEGRVGNMWRSDVLVVIDPQLLVWFSHDRGRTWVLSTLPRCGEMPTEATR